jgi:flagellar motor switch protein FliN/FliY
MADTATEQATEAPAADGAGEGSVEVQDAQLGEAPAGGEGDGRGQIDMLLDAAVPVEVSLDRIEMRVRELLRLSPGSVMKLEKEAGQPVDLYLRGVRFATGDLVVVGEKLGVRVRDIVRSGV